MAADVESRHSTWTRSITSFSWNVPKVLRFPTAMAFSRKPITSRGSGAALMPSAHDYKTIAEYYARFAMR